MSLRKSLPAIAMARGPLQADAKQNVKFRAAAGSSGTFELDIYDIVDPMGENYWWGTSFVSAKDVRAKLKEAGNVSEIIVRINSVGGDVFDGTAIYNLLKDHPARVSVHVDGICASIASIIAMAGDEITMGQGTWMMIHEPYSQFMLDARADDLRKAADTLDKMRDGLCAVYCERTGIDEKECLSMMAEETWMTAEEAKEQGFCTAINSVPLNTDDAGAEPEVAEQVEAMVAKLTQQYSRIPAGALQAMNIATTSYAIAASAAAAARPRAEDDADDAKKMKSLEEDKKNLQDEVTELKKQLKKAEEEADKAKKKAEEDKKAEDDKKAAAEFPKKDDDDDDDDSSADTDGKKAEAQAMAMLAIEARALTGAKTVAEARAALAGMVARHDRNEQVEAEMVEMAKERYSSRVSDAIAKGMVRPSRKDYMLEGLNKAKNIAEVRAISARLDNWLSASGGEAVGPALNQEHKQPSVIERTPDGKGIITAQDREINKHFGLSEEQLQQAADNRAKRFGNAASA